MPRRPETSAFTFLGRRCRTGALLAVLGGTLAGCVSAETMIERPVVFDALAPATVATSDNSPDLPRTDRAWRLRLTRL